MVVVVPVVVAVVVADDASVFDDAFASVLDRSIRPRPVAHPRSVADWRRRWPHLEWATMVRNAIPDDK